ncbi:hypothetical protein F5880DRAFT_1490598, partial [Lentinula raphanica]
GVGVAEYIVGEKKKEVQYQQQNETKENITILSTICANDSNLSPAIIFKGKGFQTK